MMNRVRHFINILCLLLVLVIFIYTLPVNATENDVHLVCVNAHTSNDEHGFWLTLLNVNGIAYISASEALELSGMSEYSETEGAVTFCAGQHSVAFSGEYTTHEGIVYYPLRELMDTLSTHYKYIPEESTLLFAASKSFYANLLQECQKVYEDGYALSYVDNVWGYGVAAVYNIIGGLRFDYIWGGYQQEQYELALAGIMQIDETTSAALELAQQGNTLMSKLSTIHKVNQSDLSGIQEYCELFGTPYDDYIEAYNAVNSLSANIFSIGDFLDIMQKIDASRNSYDLYVHSVRYGLVDNDYINDNSLESAVRTIYSYYEENTPIDIAIFQDAFATMGTNATAEALKEYIVKNGCGINSIYLKGIKLLFDEWGMSNMTKATEQTHACSLIQAAAKAKYDNSMELSNYTHLDGYTAKGLRAKNIKYSTILYLRACQYAYSLYAFDETLSWASEYWVDKTQATIETIAKFSDTDLCRTVINDELDLTNSGFYPLTSLKGNIEQIKTGEYQNENTFDELTIHEIDEQQISFSVSWYRTASVDYATATCFGDTAFFHYETDDGYYKTTGYLKVLTDNTVELNIIKTELPEIKPGKWVYQYVSEEELLNQQNALYLSWLLLNTDTKGWMQGIGIEYRTATNVFLRFYKDGTYRCYYGTEWGGETTYKEYTGKYRLETISLNESLLYIGNCAYVIDIYSAGSTAMTLSLQGSSDIDLSGHYEIAENEWYQLIFS